MEQRRVMVVEYVGSVMFHVKHCRKIGEIHGGTDVETFKKFFTNCHIFSSLLTYKHIMKQSNRGRAVLVCRMSQFSYVSRETLLEYSRIYNRTDTGTLG